MKLTVLVDNYVLQSQNLLAEHGLCFYIEDDDKKILFDTGYSDIFLKNAQKMGLNLLDIDYIVLSHGHYDHTWGLSHYISFYMSALKQGQKMKQPTIIAHPELFNHKYEGKKEEIGSLLSKEKAANIFDLKLSKDPVQLTEKLFFLGEIPRENDFEKNEPIGKVFRNKKYEDDYIKEDSALVFSSNEGLSIISGCSHSGICNIINYAKKIFKNNNIKTVIGGFHLVEAKKDRLNKTAEFLKSQNINEFYPCHCTDFNSKIALSKELKLNPTGVGLKLTCE